MSLASPRKSPPARSVRDRRDSPIEFALARMEILRGAAEVLSTESGTEPPIEDILRAANVSRRTFYRFFKNREEVLSALYDVATRTLLERLDRAVGEVDDAWGRLRACVRAYLAFHDDSGPLLRVLGAEALRPGSPLHARRETTIAAITALLDRETRAAQGRAIDPLVFRTLLLALEGLSNSMLAESMGGPIDRKRAEHVMLRVMGATLTPDGGPSPPMPLARDSPANHSQPPSAR